MAREPPLRSIAHGKHSRRLPTVPGAEVPHGWNCSVLATTYVPTSNRQDHGLGSPWDRQRTVTFLRCHLCGQKQPGSVTSVPCPNPCPLVEVCGHPVFLSGGRTRGEDVGKLTWLLVTPLSGGISKALPAHQEKSQLTEREKPHLEVRGIPAVS